MFHINHSVWMLLNWHTWEGGGGYSTKFYTWEPPPWDPTPFPFRYHFRQNRYPFRIPSIHKWYPFHLPSLDLCIPFNCCQCTVCYVRIRYKSRTFSRLFHSRKMHLLALLGLVHTEIIDFPTLSYTSTYEIWPPVYIKSFKKVPLSGKAFLYRSL